MLPILATIAIFLLPVAAAAHPSGNASVLDHNIVAVELSVPVNIPPNAPWGEVVRKDHSICTLVPNQVVGWDRSLTPRKTQDGRVVPLHLPLLGKPVLNSDIQFDWGDHSNPWDDVRVVNDYVEFPLASDKDPTAPHPDLKLIRCGYSKAGLVEHPASYSGRLVKMKYEYPTMDQLRDFTQGALKFIPGETVELQGR